MKLLAAAGVWCLFVCAAFACRLYCKGGVEARVGEPRSHLLFVLLSSASVFLLGALYIRGLPRADTVTLWQIGALWLLLSLLFELTLGRYVLGLGWRRIFRDYNLLRGRLYPLLLATTLLTPVVSGLLFFDSPR